MYSTKKKILYVGDDSDLRLGVVLELSTKAAREGIPVDIISMGAAIAEGEGRGSPLNPQVVLGHLKTNRYDLVIFSELCEDSMIELAKNPGIYSGKKAIMILTMPVRKELRQHFDFYGDMVTDEHALEGLLNLLNG